MDKTGQITLNDKDKEETRALSAMASFMGRKGGKKTKERGVAYYSKIGKLGATKRWGIKHKK